MNLISLDIETTGPDPLTDDIIQIGISYIDNKCIQKSKSFLVKNRVPIKEAAFAVHGITQESINKDGVEFKELAPKIYDMIQACDCIIMYSPMMLDIPMLATAFQKAGYDHVPDLLGKPVIDAYQLFARANPRKLIDYVEAYLGEAHRNKFEENSHDAGFDALYTLLSFNQQVKNNEVLESDYQGLGAIDPFGKIVKKDGKVLWNFGKFKGEEVDPQNPQHTGFFNWMRDKKFSPVTIQILDTLIYGKKEDLGELDFDAPRDLPF